MNLAAIYASVQAQNDDSKKLIGAKLIIQKEIESIKGQLLIGNADTAGLAKKLNESEEKLSRLETEERKIKSKILAHINTAVKRIAQRMDADYVLNIGDEVVYAKKKFDITDDVLREIVRLDDRKSPVSR